MQAKKPDKEFLHAQELIEILKTIEPTAEGSAKLHSLGARCQWCQANVDSWLLLKLWGEMKELKAAIKALQEVDHSKP